MPVKAKVVVLNLLVVLLISLLRKTRRISYKVLETIRHDKNTFSLIYVNWISYRTELFF